jgi:hypothetical protein
MTNPELVEFVKSGLQSGKQPETVQLEAIQHGPWSQEDVTAAMAEAMLSAGSVPAGSAAAAAPAKSGWVAHHKILVSVLLLAGLLVAGGSYAAYYLMPPNINKVQGLILDKLEEMQTVEYSGSLEGQVTTDSLITLRDTIKRLALAGENPDGAIAEPGDEEGDVAGSQSATIRLDFTGAADARDINDPRTEFSFTITAEGFVIGLETVSVSDDLFFKVTQFPDLGIKEIDQFIGKWYRVSTEDLEELELREADESSEGLTKEQTDRVMQVLKESRVFRIAERLESGEVEGKAAHRYRYTVDELALLNTVQSVMSVVLGSEPEEISATDREKFLDWVDLQGGEIWIAKKDYMPVKLTFDMLMRSVEGAPVTGRLGFELTVKSYNEDVKIEAPQGGLNLMDVVNEMLSDSRVKSADARRLADVRQIMTSLEVYYNEFDRYPRTLDQLAEEDMIYMATVPQAPTPPGGSCTEEENKYTYTYSSDFQTFSLKFCLGGEAGGFGPGVHRARPTGIE